MKLLQLVHGLPVGGTEMMVCHLVRGLRRSGWDVSVACLDQIGELGAALESEGVSVRLLGRKSGFDSGLAGRIAALVKSDRIDLVHAHQYTCFFYAALARPRSGKPLLFTEHGRFYPDVSSVKRRVFNYLFGQRADRITAVSEGVKRSLVKVEGFDGSRIDVIYNGIDLDRFRAAESESVQELRASLGILPGTKVIGTVGRLDEIKNQSFLIHALSALQRSGVEASLLLVGDGPEREKLGSVALRLGLDKYVRFLGKRNDVARILRAMDIFALSSFSEGLPMTLIEAMAASTPIVSTGVGGIPEIIKNGENGLLVDGVPPDSSRLQEPTSSAYLERYVHALRRLLADESLRGLLKENASSRARREFSLDTILQKYISNYNALCGSVLQTTAY